MADKFDLRRNIRLNSRVVSAVFDEDDNRWEVEIADGYRARAQFLITAVGILSAHYIPDFEGIDSFEGQWCHTGRWPAEGMDLAGKRVGVVGTGATGVQLITEIAKEVAHLTVFQRTANYCAPLRNRLIDDQMQQEIKASYPEIFEKCLETPGSFMHQFDPRSALDVPPEERMDQYEALWAEPGFKKWLSNFYDVMLPGEANEDYAEFVRNKIRERVHDPEVAEMLVPKDHMFGSKRLPCESGYYEVYNQDNVLLVDVREAPIERITLQRPQNRRRRVRAGCDYIRHRLRRGYRLPEPDAHPGSGRGDAAGKNSPTARVPTWEFPAPAFQTCLPSMPPRWATSCALPSPLVDWVTECIDYVRNKGMPGLPPRPLRKRNGCSTLPRVALKFCGRRPIPGSWVQTSPARRGYC